MTHRLLFPEDSLPGKPIIQGGSALLVSEEAMFLRSLIYGEEGNEEEGESSLDKEGKNSGSAAAPPPPIPSAKVTPSPQQALAERSVNIPPSTTAPAGGSNKPVPPATLPTSAGKSLNPRGSMIGVIIQKKFFQKGTACDPKARRQLNLLRDFLPKHPEDVATLITLTRRLAFKTNTRLVALQLLATLLTHAPETCTGPRSQLLILATCSYVAWKAEDRSACAHDILKDSLFSSTAPKVQDLYDLETQLLSACLCNVECPKWWWICLLIAKSQTTDLVSPQLQPLPPVSSSSSAGWLVSPPHLNFQQHHDNAGASSSSKVDLSHAVELVLQGAPVDPAWTTSDSLPFLSSSLAVNSGEQRTAAAVTAAAREVAILKQREIEETHEFKMGLVVDAFLLKACIFPKAAFVLDDPIFFATSIPIATGIVSISEALQLTQIHRHYGSTSLNRAGLHPPAQPLSSAPPSAPNTGGSVGTVGSVSTTSLTSTLQHLHLKSVTPSPSQGLGAGALGGNSSGTASAQHHQHHCHHPSPLGLASGGGVAFSSLKTDKSPQPVAKELWNYETTHLSDTGDQHRHRQRKMMKKKKQKKSEKAPQNGEKGRDPTSSSSDEACSGEDSGTDEENDFLDRLSSVLSLVCHVVVEAQNNNK